MATKGSGDSKEGVANTKSCREQAFDKHKTGEWVNDGPGRMGLGKTQSQTEGR